MKEVGALLRRQRGKSAAKMRVNRALEKLRKYFSQRGVTATTTIIAGAISANSVLGCARTILAKTATVVALAKGVSASTSTLTLMKGALKAMLWAKAKTAIITGAAVLLAVGGGTAIYETHNSHVESPGGPVEIKVNWAVGKKYEWRMEMNQTSEKKRPGQPQPARQAVKWTQDINTSVLKGDSRRTGTAIGI